ncbi:MAG: serine hydrolase [Clostridiaceae bacterium]|nr:serine hydrolase [Clostridiaceae bacterium]
MSERKPLPVATPEMVGIPSEAIHRFLEKLEEKQLNMHSVLFVRHGKLCAECYWKPFHRDRKHRMYSTSKSFTSAAIGILIGEGKLSLDDKIAKFFPDYLPENPSEWMLNATVRDLLRMSTYLSTGSYWCGCEDWGRSFIEAPATHKAGQVFAYDTSGTTLLDVLIARVAGEEFTDYLEPRLFAPLGMSEGIWCVKTGCGHAWGGSGLQATPRDLAKFALCFMNGGRSPEGEQLIPEWYVKEATSKTIDNTLYNSSFEEQQGYGYQFWQLSHDGFATLGMGSQSAYCFPEQDLIVAVNGDTQPKGSAMTKQLDALFDFVWTELSDKALPEDHTAYAALTSYMNTREIQIVPGKKESPVAAMVSGSTYRMTENKMGITSLRFDFSGDTVNLHWTNESGEHDLLYGFGRNIAQAFPETKYGLSWIGHAEGRGLDCDASAGWVDENSLYTNTWINDVAFGSLRMQFVFDGDSVTMLCDKNAEWFLTEYRGFASGTRA